MGVHKTFSLILNEEIKFKSTIGVERETGGGRKVGRDGDGYKYPAVVVGCI